LEVSLSTTFVSDVNLKAVTLEERLTELSSEQREILREKGKKDLFFFAKGILGFDWFVARIHLPICLQLEDSNNTRFRCLLPRGWLKTTLCSCVYPLWRAINNADVRILIVLNTYKNACAKLSRITKLLRSCVLLRTLYPEILPDDDCTWTTDRIIIPRKIAADEGTFDVAGTRTQITGRHYDVIIEDDTVAPELDDMSTECLCPQKDDVDQAIGFHRLLMPLLVEPIKSQILVVGTRWFQLDLHSWIRDNEPYYRSYERSALETDGHADENGTPTYPERFDRNVLDQLKTSLGPYMFSCLFLNMPLNPETMTFQQEWIQFYDQQPLDLVTYITVDPAGDPENNKGKTDWNVVLCAGKCISTGRVYVLDYRRFQGSPGKLIDSIFDLVRMYHPVVVGVEKEGYQQSLKYWTEERQRKEGLFFNVELYTTGNVIKDDRIRGLQPLAAARMLFLRLWMSELQNEMLSFPYGATKDVVDCLAAQMRFWALTVIERPTTQQVVKDVLSFDSAVRSIKERQKQTKSLGLVGDIFEPTFGDLEVSPRLHGLWN
jgi:hypothetical protein